MVSQLVSTRARLNGSHNPASSFTDQVRKPPIRRDIQGLRAIAVLAVILYHANLGLPGGYVGVDVFFVISGYVIALALLRELSATGTIDLRRFFWRRFKRLAPALGLVVSVTVVTGLFLLGPAEAIPVLAETAIAALFLFSNVAIADNTGDYFAQSAYSNPLLHVWSLSVEEQFYLFLPVVFLLVALVSSRGRDILRKRLALFVGGLTLLSLSFSFLGSAGFSPEQVFGGWFLFGFYSPVARAWEFGVGVLLALSHARIRALLGPRSAVSVTIVGLGLVISSALGLFATWPFPAPGALPAAFGTGLMISGGLHSSPITRILSWRPLTVVGDISYSLYLWHWPLISFSYAIFSNSPIALLVAAVAGFPLAALSWRYIEQRFRTREALSRPKPAALLVIAFVMPLTLTLAVGNFARSVSEELNLLNRADWPGMLEGCNRLPTPPTQLDKDAFASWADSCVWNVELTGAPIYLVGDSNAVHFSEPIIMAGKSADSPVHSLTLPGCRPLPGVEVSEDCAAYREGVFEWLATQQEGTVVVSVSDTYLYPDTVHKIGSKSLNFPEHEDVIADFYRESWKEMADSLLSAGHSVVFVQAVPSFAYPPPEWDPALCNAVMFARDTCTRELDRDVVLGLQQPAREIIVEVSQATGSKVIDFRDRYCDSSICSPVREGDLAYVDATHVSSDEARLLAPLFLEGLRGR